MNNYWHLELWDKEVIRIKPEYSEYIQKLMAAGEGSVRTKNRSIPVKNIKDFRKSDEPVDQSNLLEAAKTAEDLLEEGARAFNKPIITEEGVKARYVKKLITRRKYETQYSGQGSSYQLLDETDDGVWVAFVVPVHLITDRVTECTEEEIKKLRKG